MKLSKAFVGFLLFLTTTVATANDHKDKAIQKNQPTTPNSQADSSSLPNFSLTDQNHATVTLDTLRGKMWIAAFVFTSCGDECPLITSKMKALQTKLHDVHSVMFVSITTDPKHDTPEVMKKYAQSFKADQTNWLFLSGERKTIVDLSVKGFKLSASMTAPTHTNKFVLVDASGHIHGYYDSDDKADLSKLETDIRTSSHAKL